MRNGTRLAFALVLALAIYPLLPAIGGCIQFWNATVPPSWEQHDKSFPNQPAELDTWLIHGGVVQAPHFIDTFRWWRGTWAGQIPFYRPLSSMLFWAQWHAFGRHEARYVLVNIPLHLAAVGLFLFLCRDLFRRFRVPAPDLAAAFAGLLFVHGLGILPSREEICWDIAAQWKNLPDSLCGIFLCASLIAYLRGRSWLALILFLAGCASKEPAVIVPALLLIIEIRALSSRETRTAALERLSPLLIAAPVFLVFRALCLRTITGFTYGSGGNWSARLLPGCFGIVSSVASVHGWLALTLGILLFLLVVTVIQHAHVSRCGAGVATASALVLLGLVSLSYTGVMHAGIGERLVVGMMLYLDVWQKAVAIALFLSGFWFCLRRPELLAFGWAWALLLTIMLLFTPVGIHRFYLSDAGFAIVIAAGLAQGLAMFHLSFPGILDFAYRSRLAERVRDVRTR